MIIRTKRRIQRQLTVENEGSNHNKNNRRELVWLFRPVLILLSFWFDSRAWRICLNFAGFERLSETLQMLPSLIHSVLGSLSSLKYVSVNHKQLFDSPSRNVYFLTFFMHSTKKSEQMRCRTGSGRSVDPNAASLWSSKLPISIIIWSSFIWFSFPLLSCLSSWETRFTKDVPLWWSSWHSSDWLLERPIRKERTIITTLNVPQQIDERHEKRQEEKKREKVYNKTIINTWPEPHKSGTHRCVFQTGSVHQEHLISLFWRITPTKTYHQSASQTSINPRPKNANQKINLIKDDNQNKQKHQRPTINEAALTR